MDERKIMVDLGTVAEVSLKHDMENPVHIRCTAVLDHDIDGDLLKRAWDRTKRVYPVIDCVLGFDHGDAAFYIDPKNKAMYGSDHVYLVETEDSKNDPVHTKVPVAPGTETVGRRLISVSYYERKVSLSSYHVLLDGSGLSKVMSTLLYSYLSLYTGHEDEKPIVELREGRKPEEYYTASINEYIYSQKHEPVPLYSLPPHFRAFDDRGLQLDGEYYAGSLSVPADELMRLCKENGSNPSSMLCVLMAKAAFGVNSGETGECIFCTTLSLKKILGLDDDISNASSFAVTYVSYDDAVNKPLSEVCRRIRSEVDSQRSRDYAITYQRTAASYTFIPKFHPRMVTYLGNINIGDNTRHITDIELATDGHFVVYMAQLNDRFILTLQYDNITNKYLEELKKVLSGLGVNAEIVHPAYRILKDSQTVVL